MYSDWPDLLERPVDWLVVSSELDRSKESTETDMCQLQTDRHVGLVVVTGYWPVL